MGPVEAATGLTCSLLFNPARASRLVEDHASDSNQPGLEEVIDAVLTATWKSPRQNGLAAQTQFAVEDIVLDHLLGLAADKQASGVARAIARSGAVGLGEWLRTQSSDAAGDLTAHRAAGAAEIERFLREPEKYAPAPELPTPPGQPIGDDFEDASVE